MKKYFVVTDVHGYYYEMLKALQDAGFDKKNPDHILVSCGDLMDRGLYTLKCLKFVNRLPKKRKILIRGNHEDLIEECLNRKKFLYHDYHNGTVSTVFDLSSTCTTENIDVYDAAKENPEYIKYMKSLVDYAEIGNFIFVHGWIPCDVVNNKNQDIKYKFNENWKDGDWEAARWINGMEAWHQDIVVPNKTIVCGHWYCSFGNSRYHGDGAEFPNLRSTNVEHRRANFNPFIDIGIIALDQCVVQSHKVNCFVFEN